MKHILVSAFLVLISVSIAFADPHLAWDPPTELDDGTPIPVGEVIKYWVYAGDSATTLTMRAEELTVAEVPLATLNLATTDKWVAVSAYSDTRVGAQSQAYELPTYKATFLAENHSDHRAIKCLYTNLNVLTDTSVSASITPVATIISAPRYASVGRG